MNGNSLMLDGTSRRQREHHRKRDKLIAIAEQVFAQKGFRGASMEAIANAAEYNAAGSLYRYFETKDVLYAAVLEAKMREFVGLLTQRTKSQPDELEALRTIIRTQLEFAGANRAFFQIYFRERMEVGRAGDLWQQIDALFQQLITIYEEAIAAGQRRDLITAGDARLYAVAIEGMVEGLVRSWLTEMREHSTADVELLIEVAVRAIAVAAPAAPKPDGR